MVEVSCLLCVLDVILLDFDGQCLDMVDRKYSDDVWCTAESVRRMDYVML